MLMSDTAMADTLLASDTLIKYYNILTININYS